MELRTASTITLALVVAASIASACELLPSEPLVCAPNPTVQEPDPACTQCCIGGGGSASASASGGDDNADGSEGGSAACDELHSQCCPNLEGIDLEICETTVDELSCEIWLDIFREEGSC